MKKLLVLFAAVLSLASVPAQAAKYGKAGCGLGSILMGPGENQIFAATSNGTFGTQTFGISSGTSNCTDNGVARASKEVPLFIEANRFALANDVARGSGETIASLSQVMGCDSAARLASTLQKSYGDIFPTEKVESTQVTHSIMEAVRKNAKLSCRHVI